MTLRREIPGRLTKAALFRRVPTLRTKLFRESFAVDRLRIADLLNTLVKLFLRPPGSLVLFPPELWPLNPLTADPWTLFA